MRVKERKEFVRKITARRGGLHMRKKEEEALVTLIKYGRERERERQREREEIKR